MNDAKYIGLDVHQATISATVLDSTGKLVMESILETKRIHSAVHPGSARQFACDLRGRHLRGLVVVRENTASLRQHASRVASDTRSNMPIFRKKGRKPNLFLHATRLQ